MTLILTFFVFFYYFGVVKCL